MKRHMAAKARPADKPKSLQKTKTSGSSSCGGAWKTSAVAKSKGRGCTFEVNIEEREDNSESDSSSSDSSDGSSATSPEYDAFDDSWKKKELIAQKGADEAEGCATDDATDRGADNGDDSDASDKPKSKPSKEIKARLTSRSRSCKRSPDKEKRRSRASRSSAVAAHHPADGCSYKRR